MTHPPALTDKAAQRIKHLSAKEGKPGLFLRLMVDSGGCSGFQYKFSLDSAKQADDEVFEREGASLVIDKTSLGFLQGAQIDFNSDLSGEMFSVKNPNAEASCGCGTSFSPKN
jgi:iron-sulfur cluster insertion protein